MLLQSKCNLTLVAIMSQTFIAHFVLVNFFFHCDWFYFKIRVAFLLTLASSLFTYKKLYIWHLLKLCFMLFKLQIFVLLGSYHCITLIRNQNNGGKKCPPSYHIHYDHLYFHLISKYKADLNVRIMKFLKSMYTLIYLTSSHWQLMNLIIRWFYL